MLMLVSTRIHKYLYFFILGAYLAIFLTGALTNCLKVVVGRYAFL